MKVLDLFCGAGGAAMGLHQVWPEAEIVGVDINPQPRYPFNFVQADAMEYPLEGFDFIWASPPCQAHSRLNGINQREYRDYIEETRKRLLITDVPWVIENVVGAPLRNAIVVCGSSFGMKVWRHRLFETSGFLLLSLHCRHTEFPQPLDVTGSGGPCSSRLSLSGGIHRKPKNLAEACTAMGIDWMTRRELVQAVPPAYSEFIARQVAMGQP